MASDRTNDLKAFRDFADQRLASNGAEVTLDEALELWEFENSTEEQREEIRRSIERGIDDMNAGRTVDAFEFIERMRANGPTTGRR